MKYLSCNVLDLCLMYVTDASRIKAEIFGMNDFTEVELRSKNFDLVGDVDDFCLYEKDFRAAHFSRSVDVVLKKYFFGREDKGCGISLASGVRLITVLKEISSKGFGFEVYFFNDMLDGAVVVAERSVIRFSTSGLRAAYEVRGLDSDLASSVDGAAVKSIRKTMSCISEVAGDGVKEISAFRRLRAYLDVGGG